MKCDDRSGDGEDFGSSCCGICSARFFRVYWTEVWGLSSDFDGETSWYGFAKKIFELTEGLERQALKLVLPIGAEFYPSPVNRPNYSLLDVGLVERSFGLRLPGWDEALTVALERDRL